MTTPASPPPAAEPAIPPYPSEVGQQQNGAAPAAPAPPAPPPEPPAPPADSADELRTALRLERERHKETMQALAALKQQGMTDQEKALADARAEGRAAAVKEGGLRLAEAEFRVLAAGKLADPSATLELLDLSRFVNDDGEVDKDAMAKLVDKLIAQMPAAGRIPSGPQGAAPEDDFLRSALSKTGKRFLTG